MIAIDHLPSEMSDDVDFAILATNCWFLGLIVNRRSVMKTSSKMEFICCIINNASILTSLCVRLIAKSRFTRAACVGVFLGKQLVPVWSDTATRQTHWKTIYRGN